jgi:pantetheine-phosphate adenylyltransferase
MKRIAICPGSFDPPTEGHINIIKRGLRLFDEVIVAVAVNSSKKTRMTPGERVSVLREIFRSNRRVRVESFQNRLLVDYARQKRRASS